MIQLPIGIDILEIDRFEMALQRRKRLLNRVFTPAERDYCLRRGRPGASLAARFAAKEAVFKVLGAARGSIGWQEIEILTGPDGRPEVHLHGRAAEEARRQGLASFEVSLSHSRGLAAAVVRGLKGGS
ncbi:MAG: holo-[acyl-carrier protein] synthase [Clostridia bacterium]|nr:holo-[acyl-carrier protein] synthase [Clostridia bacterium]